MRILMVEDDAMVGESLRAALRQQGFAADWVRDGRAADAALASERFDAVLLDLGLPQRDGLQVLRALRGRGDATPVIVLTARDALADKVAGLDAGADDYLVKPFELDELLARLRAAQRRAGGRATPVLEVAGLRLDPATREVSRDGRPLLLSAREFALLQALLERPGAILSRAQLEDRLYGWGEEVESNAVSVYVHQLRRKIGDDLLHTVRGLGYYAGPAKQGLSVRAPSLRTRLFAFVALLLAAAALALGGATYRSVRAEADALFDYQLRQMALSLRDQGRIDPDAQAALADPALEVVVQIWSLDGVAVYSSGPRVALPPRAVLGYADLQLAGEAWRAFGAATPLRVIQVAQPLAVRRRLAEAAAWRSVWPVAAAAPLVALALWWLLGVSLAPLNAVVQAAGTRRVEALAPLPEAGLPAELQPLVQAFNALLARLGDAFTAQQAFVADAAHELRTPLTALKLQLDVLRATVDDPAEREQALQRLGAGVDRAARLVQQLLALARSEPGAAATLAPLDLAAVARAAADDAAARVRATGATLTLALPPTLAMTGDAEGLRSAVRNLLDNALKYGAAPGAAPQVTLSVATEGGHAVLAVEDHGPGLPAEQHAQVFERFHRLQPGEGEGSGLGLAIVRAVAQHHGGQVRLAAAPGGGLRVELRLPLQPNPQAAPA